jgi:ABC-2 type transport system ATP-binding protein
MSALPIISVRDLHRDFDKVQAVRGISFDIAAGQVVGFIGANGSGKTTTMRILATLDSPSRGEAQVCGYNVVNHPDRVRSKVGWMPDAYGSYNHMTVLDYLDFYGRAYGLARAERFERLSEVMAFTDLTELADRPMNKLSKGMSQRLCLGRTLLHDPDVLILDEPAAGLDPKARIEFKNVIHLLAKRGKTIFISSHILSELGEMCDSLVFIDAGRIVHYGSAESLRQDASARAVIDVQIAGDPEGLRQWTQVNGGVRLLEMNKRGARLALETDDPAAVAALLKRMIGDGLAVTDFHRESRKLEDAFVEMIKKVEPLRDTPPHLPPPNPAGL